MRSGVLARAPSCGHTWALGKVKALMAEEGILDRHKGQDASDSRATLQNISILDARMGLFATALKEHAGSDRVWYHKVDEAVNDIDAHAGSGSDEEVWSWHAQYFSGPGRWV